MLVSNLLLVAGVVTAQSEVPSFTYVECPFDATEGVQCGTLTVLENRANPNGFTLDLFVTVILPATATPYPTP
ncbi:MAG UNVERIFIED_CONTAM: hypothetical protein LVT10_24850 [Anaerolineae bacterium]